MPPDENCMRHTEDVAPISPLEGQELSDEAVEKLLEEKMEQIRTLESHWMD
jgi:hypothetical protein